MKRWLIRGGLVVLGLLLAGGAWLYRGFTQRRLGPPLPVCSAAPLAARTFSAPVMLHSPELPGRTFAEVTGAVLPDGAVVAAYLSLDRLWSDNRLAIARIPLEGAAQLRTLRSDRKKAYDPTVAVSGGAVHLVWLGHDSGNPEKRMQLAYSRSADGLAWSEPVDIHPPDDCPDGTRGCLDKPWLTAVPGGLSLLYYSLAKDSLRAVRIEAGRPDHSIEASKQGVFTNTAVDARGRMHLLYVAFGDNAQTVYGDPDAWLEYRGSDDGGRTFSAPSRVTASGAAVPYFFSNAQVAADPDRGFLYAAYPVGKEDLRWDIELATSTDGGKTWRRRKVNDDAPCANHTMTMMALDPKTGALHLAWLENRTGQGGVAYARCDAGGETCGPNEAISAPFASYHLGRHGDDWLGDYATLLIDPERRLLHALWTQPVDVDGDVRTRVFYARGKLSE